MYVMYVCVMYVCMYVYVMYVCIICMYVCRCMYVFVYIYIYICTYINIYVYMRIYIYIVYILSSRTYPAYIFQNLGVPRQLPNSSKTLGRGKPRTKILDQGS